jgi:serine/threonine-protein kinase
VIGRTIGNYVVQQKIGEGGMGAVYLAEHPRIRRQVAIKVLLPQFSSNPAVVARFFNEARAANEIRNEHIIDIIDFGELADDGSSYIIMEWLDGRSLNSELQAAGRFPVPRAIHVARGIARALAAAHAHGIVHRDLKPDNIFLLRRAEDPDFVKVLDFGIAKLTQQANGQEDFAKTQTGAILGTPAYMSPEQCRGLTIDHRTDIYALGCILYHMLAGRLPFDAPALGELLLKHITEIPPSPRSMDPSIPPNVDLAVMKALEKDPNNRFQRVEEVLAALSGVETGAFPALSQSQPGMQMSPVAAPRQDTLGAAAGQRITGTDERPPSSKKNLVIGGAVAVVLGLGGVAVVMTRGEKKAEEKPAPAAAATTTAPTPTATPTAPVTPRPSAAATAHVTIRTLPANAEVSLDEAPVANPFDADVPRGSTKHHVMVKAAGYKPDSQWITFDEDRKIEVSLQRELAPPVAAHEHKGAKPAAKPTPPRVTESKPVAPPPATKPPAVAPAPSPPPAPPPAAPAPAVAKPEHKNDKPVYKGTKGKLITDFPE